MKRIRASAALVLTAFFAVAGSFHHHALPKPAHDHVGFCSAATVGIALESCALCRVAHTAVDFAGGAVAPTTVDLASRLSVVTTEAPASAGSSLLRDSRAPPSV